MSDLRDTSDFSDTSRHFERGGAPRCRGGDGGQTVPIAGPLQSFMTSDSPSRKRHLSALLRDTSARLRVQSVLKFPIQVRLSRTAERLRSFFGCRSVTASASNLARRSSPGSMAASKPPLRTQPRSRRAVADVRSARVRHATRSTVFLTRVTFDLVRERRRQRW